MPYITPAVCLRMGIEDGGLTPKLCIISDEQRVKEEKRETALRGLRSVYAQHP